MPKYDFRCDECGHQFELTRSFGQVAAPATCPHDGASATRLFSPPMDVLVYNREPVVSTGRVTIPAGALSCHDHGPAAGAQPAEQESSGSSWHARGYDSDGERPPAPQPSTSHGPGLNHTHGFGRAHSHGRGFRHTH